MNRRATEDKKRRSRLADQIETARVRLAAKVERARLKALHAGSPAHLECQECDGMMDIAGITFEGTEYIVECDSCGWGAHASRKAVDTGSWED